jgi:hypothetical protein
MVRMIKKKEVGTASEMQSKANALGLQRPTARTYSTEFRRAGLRHYRLVAKFPLTPQKAKTRLAWAKIYKNLRRNNWARMLCCDECALREVELADAGRVCLPVGTPLGDGRVASGRRVGGVKVSVWGYLAASGRAYIVPLNGRMNGPRYLELLKGKFPAIIAENFLRP